MENADMFMIIWNILRSFGNIVVIWFTYFPSFWYIVSRKIWQPWCCSKNNDAMAFISFQSFPPLGWFYFFLHYNYKLQFFNFQCLW
jgi:hypothetical protein